MKKNGILVSIAVPTYNRPKEFKRMLFGLLPQLTSETELIIKDDSETDETKEIFNELVKKINSPAKFTYFKGKKTADGVDAAYLFLIENSSGEYIRWFSDDDEFMPGAIAKTLELVKKYPEITFIWVNFCYGENKNLAVDRKDGFFKNGNEVLELLGTNIGLSSTLFFRKEDAFPSLLLAKKHIRGFSFACLVPIFHILSGNGKFYFLRGPYILNHPTIVEEIKTITTKSGKIKNEGFNVYGIDFYNIVMEFKDKFDRRSIKKILTVNFASLWRGMLVGWIGGWDTPKGKRWQMFKLYWNFPEFWIAIVPFLMPLWVNKILFKIYKIFFSHRKFVFAGKIREFLNRQ